MIVLLDRSTGRYLRKISCAQGQPMAVSTPVLDMAKGFKTAAAAEKMRQKWEAAGIGLKSYVTVHLGTAG